MKRLLKLNLNKLASQLELAQQEEIQSVIGGII